MFQDIQFIPRYVAEQMTPKKDDKWALISIREVGEGYPSVSDDWFMRIFLEFDDTDNTEDPNVFSFDDAERIVKFLDQCADKEVTHLFVHCLAGVSRSAGVAMFAADYIGCDMFEMKFGNYRLYNKWVYHKLNQVVQRWT